LVLFSKRLLLPLTEEYIITGGANASGNGVIIVDTVPEPSTWVMMLIGFAGLGFAFRQSRRKVSFV
jgi:hypothetical protein